MTTRNAPSPSYPGAEQIRFWMTTPAIAVSPDAPLSEALVVMHEHSFRRLPVVDAEGTLCGIITDGDIRGASVLHPTGMSMAEIATSLRRITVFEVMADHPITITPDTTLREAALLMLDNKIGGLPVVAGEQSLVGVLTESDLFEALVCYLDHAEPER